MTATLLTTVTLFMTAAALVMPPTTAGTAHQVAGEPSRVATTSPTEGKVAGRTPEPPQAPAQAARPTPIGTRLAWRPEARGQVRLLWTGFRAPSAPGHHAEVVIQTSGPVEMELRADPAGAHLRLKHCRGTRRRTDRLPLDTRFFDSAVSRVAVMSRGRDVEVQITLRTPSVPLSRQEPGPGGSSFWIFSFARPVVGDLPQAAERS